METIIKFTLKILGLYVTEDERKLNKLIKEKQLRLAEFGGRIEVYGRGGIRTVFKTKEGEQAYYKSIRPAWDTKKICK